MSNHDQEAFAKTVEQLMTLFVSPEVARRQATGELPTPVQLNAAQVIFFSDGRKPEIRMNADVRAIGAVRLKPGVIKNYGDDIYESEIEGVDRIQLTEDDDPDCGHATLIRYGNQWLFGFDFIYNKGLSRKHIATATEFVEAAEYSLNKHNWAACIDNLYSAVELLARSVLLGLPDAEFRMKATHAAVHSRYNRFAQLGNADPVYADVYNRLYELRKPARYLRSDTSITEDETRQFLDTVRQMLSYAGAVAGL